MDKRTRASGNEAEETSTQKIPYALDYLRCSTDSLAAWLHRSFWWRAHSFVARHRGRRPDR